MCLTQEAVELKSKHHILVGERGGGGGGGINNDWFLTGKLRELNRLCKSAQVADRKLCRIRSSDQAVSF